MSPQMPIASVLRIFFMVLPPFPNFPTPPIGQPATELEQVLQLAYTDCVVGSMNGAAQVSHRGRRCPPHATRATRARPQFPGLKVLLVGAVSKTNVLPACRVDR